MKLKKMIIYVYVMLIYVNNIEKQIFLKLFIYVNFMLIYVNIGDRQTHQKYSSEPHISKIGILERFILRNRIVFFKIFVLLTR